MRVAIITITYNDGYKIKEWYDHYQEYKNQVLMHIIVDNGSDANYKQMLREKFLNSHIIEREKNGGCTGAYNDGIKLALSCLEVDAIMLLGNDIKLSPNAIPRLIKALEDNDRLGMVAPVLLKKNSMTVEDYGCAITRMLLMKPKHLGESFNSIEPYTNYCESLTGGANLSRKEFYVSVGLQDEKLFMYSDEVDVGIRALRQGYMLASVGTSIAWHQHINSNTTSDRRDAYTKYLAGRNKIYLLRKHFGTFRAIEGFFFYTFASIYKIGMCILMWKLTSIKEYRWLILGALYGLAGVMEENKYSKPDNK